MNKSETASNANKKNREMENDLELLNLIWHDSLSVSELYKPGPYWIKKTKSALNELRNKGLIDFRGYFNGAATSYGDNSFIDTRLENNYGLRSLFNLIYQRIYPFNSLFNSQVNLTRSYHKQLIQYKNKC